MSIHASSSPSAGFSRRNGGGSASAHRYPPETDKVRDRGVHLLGDGELVDPRTASVALSAAEAEEAVDVHLAQLHDGRFAASAALVVEFTPSMTPRKIPCAPEAELALPRP